MSIRTNQSAKKPISDRISIFEQKQQQAPSSLPNRGQNQLVTKKTVSAGKNFSAIKSQFDAGKVPVPVPEKPTEKEPENGSVSPSIATPDNSRPASTVSTSRKNSTARKNSAGSAAESTSTTASSSPPPSAKSSVSSVTSTASKTAPRVAKNLTAPGNSRTAAPVKTNKVIATEKVGSSRSSAPPTASAAPSVSAPPTASAKSSVASVAESNGAPSSARAPRGSVAPPTTATTRSPVKQPVAPKRSSSPANKLQRTQSTVKTSSAPTKVATASKTAPIPAPVVASAPKKIVVPAPVKQNGVKASLASSQPASGAPNKPILAPSKGKATVPPASQQPLKSALKKTPTAPKEIDIPEVPSADKVIPVEESLPPASPIEVSKKTSIGAEPRKKSTEQKEPIVVTNKKSVTEPTPPVVVNQTQQVKPEPVNLKSKKVSASGFKSEPDNKVVKKTSVSSVKDQKKISLVNKKSVTEVPPVTSLRKDSAETILVKEPELKIEEEEKISPPTSIISLESIGKVETTSSATVALLIITDDKPASRLGQTSLPDSSLSKNFVAETCLNVSAVDIEELEDQESEVPTSTRESKLSELSYSVSSSVEDLQQERERNYSVSSSGSDQSTDDYPTAKSVRPEVPTVTVTLEEPESKPVAAPIILIERNDSSENIFDKSSVLRPKPSESELNLKNMSTDSLNEIPSSGLVRSSYWTNQALQNDNAQKINEVMKLDLDYKEEAKADVAVSKESENGSTNPIVGSTNPSYVGLSGSSSVTSGSSSGEDFSLLKRQKHELELKLKEEEEEIDDLASQVQMLEQTKIKLEQSITSLKKEHRAECAQKDEELEECRINAQKKLKALEQQLESEHEERINFVREKHDLETKIIDLQEMTSSRTSDDDLISKLRKDLRRTKALLKDAQSTMERSKTESSSKVVLRQLRNQLEDAEFAKTAAIKFRQNLELELSDVQQQLDDVLRGKSDTEDRLMRMSREKADLSTQLEESEEELQEVMKRYRASVSQISVDQITIQEQANRISDLEEERSKLKEQITELLQKIESLEGESVADVHQSRLELKIKELESKLELEQTTRGRMETQINRLKEGIEKLNSECDQLRAKELSSQELARKLQRQLRDLKEEHANAQQRETDSSSKKNELEKQLELSEAEALLAKNDLKLALKRIEDLQTAINGELESDSDSMSDGDSDSSDDLITTYHSRTIPKIRTTFVRDSFKNRHLEAMAEEPEYKMY